MKTQLNVGLAALTVAMLGACAPYPQYPQNPQPYDRGPPPPPVSRGYVAPPVAYNTGVISAIQPMRAEEQRVSPVGVIAGAVIGGLLGNQVGAGNGRAAATVAGAAVGGYAGNEVGRRAEVGGAPDVFRISVQLDGGGYQDIDVRDPAGLRIGERVRIEGNGQISRY